MILKNENLTFLLEIFNIQNFNENHLAHLELLNQSSINDIFINNGQLPNIPPFEKHPYLNYIENNISFEGIIIGTFPPISYLCDNLNFNQLVNTNNELIFPPTINYFHGNKNSFWKYSPINFENIINHPRELIGDLIYNQLIEYNIIYSDIIKFCQRKLINNSYTANDDCLNNIVINNEIYSILFSKNINKIYFTNSSFFVNSEKLFDRQGNYTLKKRDSFQLFLKGANDLGIKIEFNIPNLNNEWLNINEINRNSIEINYINNLLCSKVLINLKLKFKNQEKVFKVVSCLSPAAVNRGTVRKNNVVINHSIINNVNIEDSPRLLLQETLECFFNNNLMNLLQYNY